MVAGEGQVSIRRGAWSHLYLQTWLWMKCSRWREKARRECPVSRWGVTLA